MSNFSKFMLPALAVVFASTMPNISSALDFRHVHLDEERAINQAGKHLNHICRDRFDNDQTNISPELFSRVEQVVRYFEAQGWRDIEVELLSCYRSPETNSDFRNEGRQVARKSQHMLGQAMDIALNGIKDGARINVPPHDIFRVACAITKNKGYGGVGYYRAEEFVHMDVRPNKISDWGANCP